MINLIRQFELRPRMAIDLVWQATAGPLSWARTVSAVMFLTIPSINADILWDFARKSWLTAHFQKVM